MVGGNSIILMTRSIVFSANKNRNNATLLTTTTTTIPSIPFTTHLLRTPQTRLKLQPKNKLHTTPTHLNPTPKLQTHYYLVDSLFVELNPSPNGRGDKLVVVDGVPVVHHGRFENVVDLCFVDAVEVKKHGAHLRRVSDGWLVGGGGGVW
jgi:hypothetical protein